MSSSLRRGTLAATAIALSVAPLTACGAGNNAETLKVKPDNAAMTVGDIKIQNVNVVTSTDGDGPAAVSARIFNEGTEDQTLDTLRDEVTGGRAELNPAKGERKLTVPAGGSLMLGGKGNAQALFENAEEADVRHGAAHGLTFNFSNTGTVEMEATVVPAGDHYQKFGPSGDPSSSETEAPGRPDDKNPGDGRDGDGGQDSQDGQDGQDSQDGEKGQSGQDGEGDGDGASGSERNGSQGSDSESTAPGDSEGGQQQDGEGAQSDH